MLRYCHSDRSKAKRLVGCRKEETSKILGKSWLSLTKGLIGHHHQSLYDMQMLCFLRFRSDSAGSYNQSTTPALTAAVSSILG
jgi:hypothetical protein